MVQILDHGITETRERGKILSDMTMMASGTRTPFVIPICYICAAADESLNEEIHMNQTQMIPTCYFSLNRYSDEQCLIDFSFLRKEIPIISNLFGWNRSTTSRNGYRCDYITDACIVLRRLSAPARWRNLEENGFLHQSQLCEVF